MEMQTDKNDKSGSAELCLLYTFLPILLLGFCAENNSLSTDSPFKTSAIHIYIDKSIF